MGRVALMAAFFCLLPAGSIGASESAVFVKVQQECYATWKDAGSPCYIEKCDYAACMKTEITKMLETGLIETAGPDEFGEAHEICFSYYTLLQQCRDNDSTSKSPSPPAPSSQPPVWREVNNAMITGFDKEVLENVPLAHCKAACLERDWCKSVDYEREAGRCFIQPVNENDTELKTDYPGNPYDHYFLIEP